MGRRPGPLDRGQGISTVHLLTMIDLHGPHWPAELADFTIEAVSTAVGREIACGNLADGVTLSVQGRATLERLRGGRAGAGHLSVRRGGCAEHADSCWRVCCACGEVEHQHVRDYDVEALVSVTIAEHECAQGALAQAG